MIEMNGVQGMPVSAIDAGQPTDESAMPDTGGLAGLVARHYTQAQDGRRTKQSEWIEDLRAWKGEYAPDVLANLQTGKSQIFVKLTRAWCGAARSLIMSLLGQDGGFPWDISPSPVPDIEGVNINVLKEAVEMAAQQLPPDQAETFKQGNDFESMAENVKKEAQDRCDRMKKEMEDQLAEMNWEQTFTKALLPYVIFGTMVVKGPVSVPKRPRQWVKEAGTWKLALKRWSEAEPSDLRPEMKVLDVFSVYPDPVARTIDEAEYVIVRHVMSRHDLRNLKKAPGFDADEIEEVLFDHPAHGNWVAEEWEETVDATTDHTPNSRKHDRFEVKEWWGHMSGRMLRDHGISIDEGLLEAECLVNLWECAGKMIKVTVSNLEPPKLPFYFVPYEDVHNSIWGQGVPRQMEDSQALYNAAERCKVDNMGMSSGPQTVVDMSRLSDRTNASTQAPWKIWFVNDMEGLSQPPVQFFQPQSNVPHMQAIQADARQHLQKETSLPDFVASGVPGNLAHNRTAEGLSMSQNAALAFIRTVIGNIDTYLTQCMMESLYHWNMAFNPNDEIKGDSEVVAKGVNGAMSREVLTQRLNQLLVAAANPEIRPWIKVDQAVQLWARAMGYTDMDLTYTPDQVMENKQKELAMQAEAESAPKRVQPVMPRENAVMQLLLHTPPTSPMYGAIYVEASQIWGLMTPRLGASIDVWDRATAQQFQALASPQDTQTIAAPLSQEELNAPSSPAAGTPNGPQGGMPPQPVPAGQVAGMGTPGGLPQGLPG